MYAARFWIAQIALCTLRCTRTHTLSTNEAGKHYKPNVSFGTGGMK